MCIRDRYSETHLGHAKSYVSFDILKRWLTYKGYEVTHIQNFTDVSDETAEGALKEGVDEFTFTQKYEREFLDNMALLSNTHATKYTRASDFAEKIAMETRKLLEAGEAYQTEQGVFVRINQDDHGKLLRVNLEESLAEGTSDVDSGPKESPHDTLLWGLPLEGGKSWEVDGLPPGRPGWHLECTIMSSSELDLPIDIHWGGIDLIYPHHETEMILAEKIGLGHYCDFWMHNGLMEDAATAEISRSSLWQWVKHSVTMDTGIVASKKSFEKMLDEEYNVVQEEVGQNSLDSDKLVEAKKLLKKLWLLT